MQSVVTPARGDRPEFGDAEGCCSWPCFERKFSETVSGIAARQPELEYVHGRARGRRRPGRRARPSPTRSITRPSAGSRRVTLPSFVSSGDFRGLSVEVSASAGQPFRTRLANPLGADVGVLRGSHFARLCRAGLHTVRDADIGQSGRAHRTVDHPNRLFEANSMACRLRSPA